MLIALTGKARAGKDTAACALVQTYGFYSTAFAAALKEACMFKFGLSQNDVMTQEGKARYVEQWGLTVGEILQREGTEGTRDFWGEDFWLRRWDMTYQEALEQGYTDVVVTDCRFDNEAQAIIDRGGKVIKITRPDLQPLTGRDPNHRSEAGVSDQLISRFIVNNAGVQELKDQILGVVASWRQHG